MKYDITVSTVGLLGAALSAADIYAAVSGVATIICAVGLVAGWIVKLYRIVKKWKDGETDAETAFKDIHDYIESEVKPHADSDRKQ